jgi:hypothetical protein
MEGGNMTAKPKKKPKRLLYLRASFSKPDDKAPSRTLEIYLRKAYKSLPNVEDRVVEYAGQSWFGNWFETEEDCIFFQFSAATPGENATIVPTSGLKVPTIDLKPTAPPKDSEFSDGDIICCVKNDDIFACCSHLRDSAIRPYLLALFSAVDIGDRTRTLQIDRPGNFDKIRMIKSAGVKSIILNAALDSSEFQRLDKIKPKGFFHNLIRDLSIRDRGLVEAARAAGSMFKVGITVPKKGQVGPLKWFDEVAEETLDEGIPYRIETRDGKVITPEEITITRPERFEAFGKTVFRSEAMTKLREFKDDFLNQIPVRRK